MVPIGLSNKTMAKSNQYRFITGQSSTPSFIVNVLSIIKIIRRSFLPGNNFVKRGNEISFGLRYVSKDT